MSNVKLTVSLPVTRQDGSALAAADIATITFLRALGPSPAATLATQAATNLTYTDTDVPEGDAAYSFFVTDTKGNTGAVSASVTVSIEAALSPPAAGTLTAVVQ